MRKSNLRSGGQLDKMTDPYRGGIEVLIDHARKDQPVAPRHCACRGCRLGHGHNPAVPR